MPQVEDERRNLQVLDTTNNLTVSEMHELKQLAQFWSSGKMFVALTIGLGAFATASVAIWNTFFHPK